jgi:hypothetical protein
MCTDIKYRAVLSALSHNMPRTDNRAQVFVPNAPKVPPNSCSDFKRP